MTNYFGTDGVRGVANKELTPELAFKLGRIGGHVLTQGVTREAADPCRSGYTHFRSYA